MAKRCLYLSVRALVNADLGRRVLAEVVAVGPLVGGVLAALGYDLIAQPERAAGSRRG